MLAAVGVWAKGSVSQREWFEIAAWCWIKLRPFKLSKLSGVSLSPQPTERQKVPIGLQAFFVWTSWSGRCWFYVASLS